MNLANAILSSIALILVAVMVFRELRYTFRKRASEEWPTVEATLESATGGRGRPTFAPQGVIHRVHFSYSYCANDVRYTGLFCLIAGNKKLGAGLRQALTGKRVVIKYDTRHPGVSFLFDRWVMGKRVLQSPQWTSWRLW